MTALDRVQSKQGGGFPLELLADFGQERVAGLSGICNTVKPGAAALVHACQCRSR